MTIWKATIHTSVGSLQNQNVIWVDESTSGAFAATVATQVGTRFQLTLLTELSNNLDLDGVDVVDSGNTTMGQWVPAGAASGGVGERAFPPNCAMRVQKSIQGSNRRGQMWLPAVPLNSVDEFGNISASRITSLQAELDSFLTGLGAPVSGGTSLDMVVPLGGAATSAFPQVTQMTPANIVGSQRRRRF